MIEFHAYIPSYTWSATSDTMLFEGVDAEFRLIVNPYGAFVVEWPEWTEYYKLGKVQRVTSQYTFETYRDSLLCVPTEVFLETLSEDCATQHRHDARLHALLTGAYDYVNNRTEFEPHGVVLMEKL